MTERITARVQRGIGAPKFGAIYFRSHFRPQIAWKALQLAIFFTATSTTFIDPNVSLPVLVLVQVPTLIVVCGALAYIATSLLARMLDAVAG